MTNTLSLSGWEREAVAMEGIATDDAPRTSPQSKEGRQYLALTTYTLGLLLKDNPDMVVDAVQLRKLADFSRVTAQQQSHNTVSDHFGHLASQAHNMTMSLRD